jgi:predicted dehydrogenase
MRIGVIGFGKRMRGVIANLRAQAPDLQVAGIVDTDPKGVSERLDECDKERAVFYDDLKSLVTGAKPDALAIGTRCDTHTPYAIEAAKYDIPLYLEKPVAIHYEQAQSLEKAWEKAKAQVVVSFPLKVSPLCRKTREMIEQGVTGEPVHILGVNYVPYGTIYWEHLYRDYSITGGLFLQKATHDLDYMTFLMGSPIVRVAAMGTFQHVFGGKKKSGLTCGRCPEAKTCLESPRNRKKNASAGGYEGSGDDHNCVFSVDCGSVETGTNEDCSSVLMEFASGAHGVYTQVFFTRRDAARRGAVVSGYMGTVDMDWCRSDVKVVHHHQPFSDTIRAGESLSHHGGDAELSRDFIDIVNGHGTSRTPIQDGIQSVYYCLAARDSLHSGTFVKVRHVGE